MLSLSQGSEQGSVRAIAQTSGQVLHDLAGQKESIILLTDSFAYDCRTQAYCCSYWARLHCKFRLDMVIFAAIDLL
jgi:hypothetical protein